MAACLPMEITWAVLQHVPSDEIVRNRRVCRSWREVVDHVSTDEWRRLFCTRVCSVLCVGPEFDWKGASVRAANRRASIRALCTWHKVCVRVCPPWLISDEIDSPMRTGVVRATALTHMVDYVYENTFRLRGLGRSCIQREVRDLCRNCVSKRQCLFMQYDYYLRPLALNPMLDERLGQYLCET